jgi:crotonobetaine/carnitine-CoA ligase
VTCGRAIEIAVEPRHGDVFYVWEPMYHIGGNQAVIVALRNAVRLAIAPRFSVERFWSDVAEQRVTHVHYLGGMLQILVKGAMPDRHGIRVLWGGGCPAALWSEVAAGFGLTPTEVYGMTEGSSITTVNRGGPPGSVGVPLPFYDIAVVAEDGSAQPTGATGEVVVRDRGSGRLTSGYWHQPEATRRLLPGDGLMHTGDMGCLDADGYLYFVGRKNDSVRNNGENVSAWEVESTIASHPDVAECAMIGVDSDHGDQDIKMFVRLRPGAQLEPQQLSDWCVTRLARFQLPRYITMVTDLPKTPTLRVRKDMLRQLGDTPWDRLAVMSQGNAP